MTRRGWEIFFSSMKEEQEFEDKMARLYTHQKIYERTGVPWVVYIEMAKRKELGNLTWLGEVIQ